MPQVSVIVPTVRPEQIRECLASIIQASVDLDVEPVVVADFREPVDLLSIAATWWMYRPNRVGPIAAICDGAMSARGDYLFLIGDENRTPHGTIKALYDKAEAYRAQGIDKILFPNCGGWWSYYGVTFPPFPFGRRDLFARIGGLLDPVYGAHYADPDLGMRAHAAGVEVEWCHDIPIEHNNHTNDPVSVENRTKYYARDMATFRTRWDHLGAFKERPD